MDNARVATSKGAKRAATSSRRTERMTRSLSSSASTSTVGGVTGTDSVADRLLSQESGIEAKDLVDSDSITLPLSLIKGLRRKSSSIGIGSTSSGGGGSGNNSDNSGLVSFGENNSFGFNFDSEEGLMNSSPPNSERNGESDSDGNGPVDVTASSTNASGMTGGVEAMEVDKTPASLPGQVTTSGGGSGSSSSRNKQAQHMPPESKPSSSSLNSQRSGSGSSDSGGDSGSGSGSSGDGSGTSGSNGNGSRSSGKSTVSSLTMSSNSNGENPSTSTTTAAFLSVNSESMTQEAAADAAVAHLQSLASAYTPQNKATKDTKKTHARSSGKVSSKKKKSSASGRKRKAEDDDEEDNDSGGYNSDDEGGMAASRAPLSGDTSTATPDVTASLPAGGAAAMAAATSSNDAAAAAAVAAATAAMAPPPQTKSSSPASSKGGGGGKGGGGPPNKKVKAADRREERNQREKERSFRISRQINDLRNLLSSGGVIVPKGTKSAVLTEAANYIRMLQQHQYKSEIDRHQLIQQMQMIGGGALGPQAASAVRHVAAQNGVWSLGNFGGVPPRSAMTYYQQGPFGVPGSGEGSEPQQQQAQQPRTDPQLVTKIDEHEYRFVFNSCSVGMAIASMGGAFIDCNSLFCQLSQYSKQEVCSMTIFNLTSRQDLQHAFDLISKMISPPPDESEDGNGGNTPPCVLRGAMKHRNDLGLSISLIKGEDGIAKCFCVTLIKNPSSPFDASRPIPATADFLQVGGPQFMETISEEKSQAQSPGSMSTPAYTTG